MMMVVFKCRRWRGWAGLSSSQTVLGAIGNQVGAEGNLSKDGSAHSHGSAEPCLCCCAGAGEMPSCSGSGAAGRVQWISVKPKRVPKIKQRGLVPPPLCLMDHPRVQGRGSITSMVMPKGAAVGPWSLGLGEWSCSSRRQLEADFFLQ